MDFALSDIRGIGPARLRALEAAGITTVRELIMFLPKEYRDLTEIVSLSSLQEGQTAAVRVRTTGEARQTYFRGLCITKVFVTDGTEVLPVVWYNQPWLKDSLTKDKELLLFGKLERKKGVLQISSPTTETQEGLIPIYKSISGIPAKAMRQTIEHALKLCEGQWRDELPVSLRRRFGLCERNFAMRNAHFPINKEALATARKRIAFEELLLYQVALGLFRRNDTVGIQFDFTDDAIDEFWSQLPFPPTGAQRRVIKEIADDLRSPHAMARMVQGDVGSGKTALAFAAISLAHKCGYQSALMAPTEVLARQHYESALETLAPLGCRVGLLVGSLTAKQHKVAHEATKSGEWDVIIGTHALITDKVEYQNIGLVITDEQHRFGVKQRTLLSQKGDTPNVLVMSATPIPRTLALILYGDLDISIVDELPPGRKPVATRIVPESKRGGMYNFLRTEVGKGRQVYIVCPLIEESEVYDWHPAEQVYEELRTKTLSDLRIALVHGKLKASDKDAILEQFRKGEIDVLVSTTVIEVGVNVPNATIMVIENADRFGLAQLHQLRGRVGRGKYESWCFLMANPNENLKIMTSTNDGFVIAQKDMELRGPGELFGTRQSGAICIGVDLLASDTELLKITHDLAREILNTPNEPDSVAVISLAKARYSDKLQSVSAN